VPDDASIRIVRLRGLSRCGRSTTRRIAAAAKTRDTDCLERRLTVERVQPGVLWFGGDVALAEVGSVHP
jgi:hypothetical protein